MTKTLSLYPHQNDAEDKIRHAMRSGYKRIMLCAATGFGKTELAADIIAKGNAKESHVAFICDRMNLAWQTSERFWDYGIMHGLAQAENTQGRLLPIQVATAQTLESRDYWDDELTLAFLDEAHVQRRKIQEKLREWGGYCIGLSATPITPGLGEFWETIVNGSTVNQLLAMIDPETDRPYLAPLKLYAATEVDMTGAPLRRGEWTAKAARERGRKIIGDVVGTYIKQTNEHFGGPVPTLVFSADIQHGEDLVAAFQNAGIDARQTTHRDDAKKTKELIENFGDRQYPLLISVEKCVKGFDQKIVQCVVGTRAYHKSLAALLQQMGRAMRPAPFKDYALYIDHGGNLAGWYDDIMDFWENGVDHLDDTVTQKVRKEGRERTAPVCPFCGFLIQRVDDSMSICPSCGYQHTKKQNYVNVNGYVAPVKGGKKRDQMADGIKAKAWGL